MSNYRTNTFKRLNEDLFLNGKDADSRHVDPTEFQAINMNNVQKGSSIIDSILNPSLNKGNQCSTENSSKY